MNDERFTFGQPDWLGMPQPAGFLSYSGLIPPRLNKSYVQHPVATMILGPVHNRRPQSIVMRGVGLTDSDVDLISLYQRWAETAVVIEVINPSVEVAERAGTLFGGKVTHFPSLADWEKLQGRSDV